MEIVLIVAVLAFAGWFFFLRPKKEETKAPEAPYKIEQPAVGKPDPEVKMVPEDVAPVVEAPVLETPQPQVASVKPKKATKPRAPKTEAVKTKPATKGAKVKRTK